MCVSDQGKHQGTEAGEGELDTQRVSEVWTIKHLSQAISGYSPGDKKERGKLREYVRIGEKETWQYLCESIAVSPPSQCMLLLLSFTNNTLRSFLFAFSFLLSVVQGSAYQWAGDCTTALLLSGSRDFLLIPSLIYCLALGCTLKACFSSCILFSCTSILFPFAPSFLCWLIRSYNRCWPQFYPQLEGREKWQHGIDTAMHSCITMYFLSFGALWISPPAVFFCTGCFTFPDWFVKTVNVA